MKKILLLLLFLFLFSCSASNNNGKQSVHTDYPCKKVHDIQSSFSLQDNKLELCGPISKNTCKASNNEEGKWYRVQSSKWGCNDDVMRCFTNSQANTFLNGSIASSYDTDSFCEKGKIIYF